MKRRKKKTFKEFSKQMAYIIIVSAVIQSYLPYILALFDKEVPEQLAIANITEIIGAFGIYCVKAFKGKEKEESTRLKEMKLEHDFREGMEDLNL